MQSSENGSSSSTIPHLISAGLFVATALASQWLQHNLQKDHDRNTKGLRRKGGSRLAEGDCNNNNSSSSDESSRQRQSRIRSQRQRIRRQREQKQPHTQQSSRNSKNIWKRKNKTSDEEGYQVDQEEDDDDLDDQSFEYHEFYQMRRLEDRLSFENLHLQENGFQNVVTTQITASSPQRRIVIEKTAYDEKKNPQPSSRILNNSVNHGHPEDVYFTKLTKRISFPTDPELRAAAKPKKNQHQHNRPRRRHRESAIDREDEYDFLPKNSNWNHFERYNEDDLKRGVVTPMSHPPGGHYHQHLYSPSSYCYTTNRVPNADYHLDESAGNTSTEGISVRQGSPIALPENISPSLQSFKERNPATSSNSHQLTNEPEISIAYQRERCVSGDSNLTVPTENKETSTIGSPPLNSRQPPYPTDEKRQFLRHADSVLDGSSPADEQQVRLPQRFVPKTSAAKRHRKHDKPPRTDNKGFFPSDDTSDASTMSSSSNQMKEMGVAKRIASPNLTTSDLDSNHNRLDVNSSHRLARARYNAKIMPTKVVMIRHGQSMGNINEELYATTPDNAMPLTKLGWDQARKAGQHLRNNVLAPLESVHFIVSPYARTVETFHGIVSAWCDPDSPEFASIPNRETRLKAWYGKLLEMGITFNEDPRVREQDFGNFQRPSEIRKAKQDRHRFGTFYYRFPHGESASDVFDRVSTFLDSLWRSFDMNRTRNYVLVTHGISIRVLLARYFRYTIHQFNMLANPRNCEMVVLGHDGFGRLRLQGRYELLLKTKAETSGTKQQGKVDDEKDGTNKKQFSSVEHAIVAKADPEMEVDEYRFYKRLRILPMSAIRKVDIRISYNDGI